MFIKQQYFETCVPYTYILSLLILDVYAGRAPFLVRCGGECWVSVGGKCALSETVDARGMSPCAASRH